jgi:hypothetical protein
MTTMRTVLLALGIAALLVSIILIARHKEAVLVAGLPVRIVCADQSAAKEQAGPGAIAVLGTGSMAPYIPAALPGLDPLATIVAYAVLDSTATFDGITKGALIVYLPAWTKGQVMHQAAARDAGGWIMSGLHNERSETWERLTPANYVGTVARVYVWPPR